MTGLSSEAGAVQYPMVRYATEVGWEYLPPGECLMLRRGESGLVLWDIMITQLQRLNPGVVDNLRAEEIANLRYSALKVS